MNSGDENGALPTGWVSTTMGAVADVVGGGTPKTKVPGNFSNDDGHPWLTPADLTGRDAKTVSRGRRFLTDQGLATSAAKYMPAGTILFSSRAPIGYVAIATNPITTNQGFRSFVPSDALDPDYAYHYLKSITALAEQMASGTTFNELSGSKAKTLPLPLPPVAEQRRIAARLDEIDARRSAVAARLHVARATVQRLRTAVLWAMYEEASAHTGGEIVGLDSLLREPLKNGYSARPVAHETGVRVLTLTATTSGQFDASHFKYTEDAVRSDSPLWLHPGDILIQRGNTAEYVGVPAVYDGPSGAFIYPDLMIRARVREDIDPRFVWYMLLSPQARSFLRDRATGTAGNMPKVNQTTVKAVPLPLPEHEDRQRIVDRLDRAFAFADTTDHHIENLVHRIGRVASAARSRAFAGELVATEAALAEAEGRDYESASELLARSEVARPVKPSRRQSARA
ncbi:MAG: restriction endonuclease subunit S [Solirubrobacteraceae bacterium]